MFASCPQRAIYIISQLDNYYFQTFKRNYNVRLWDYLLCKNHQHVLSHFQKWVLSIKQEVHRYGTSLRNSVYIISFHIISQFTVLWKSTTVKCDHDLYEKINIFSVKSTFFSLTNIFPSNQRIYYLKLHIFLVRGVNS